METLPLSVQPLAKYPVFLLLYFTVAVNNTHPFVISKSPLKVGLDDMVLLVKIYRRYNIDC